MTSTHRAPEIHHVGRIGWLRAAVLGANDGIVSTASLIVGVAAATPMRESIVLSGVAGLVAGALSMAAGEYVSVSSQSDVENADLEKERRELETNLDYEYEELTQIYVHRGLDRNLAEKVSEQLMAHDALGSHARDELGIHKSGRAQPFQAAIASAATFSGGAAIPLLVVLVAPLENLIYLVFFTALISLITLGVLAARAGGANPLKGALRVGFWGAFAMATTAIVGSFFDTVV